MKRIFCVLLSILIGFIVGLFTYKHFLLDDIYHFKPDEMITYNHTRPIDELKRLVLAKGDTLAYDELRIAYLDVKPYQQEYLLYSIIMANKYNYPRANYYVYFCLTTLFEMNIHIGSIDEKTKELALSYLQKGVELNDYQSLSEMGELNMEGKYVKKDTLLGKKLLKKANIVLKQPSRLPKEK